MAPWRRRTDRLFASMRPPGCRTCCALQSPVLDGQRL